MLARPWFVFLAKSAVNRPQRVGTSRCHRCQSLRAWRHGKRPNGAIRTNDQKNCQAIRKQRLPLQARRRQRPYSRRSSLPMLPENCERPTTLATTLTCSTTLVFATAALATPNQRLRHTRNICGKCPAVPTDRMSRPGSRSSSGRYARRTGLAILLWSDHLCASGSLPAWKSRPIC